MAEHQRKLQHIVMINSDTRSNQMQHTTIKGYGTKAPLGPVLRVSASASRVSCLP